MDRDLTRQLVTIVTYVATVAVNAAAVAIPLGGMTTGEISDMFPVPIVPASYVFSIWSAIYLLLLAFTVYQSSPGRRTDATLRRLGYLPALTGVLNAAWVLLWQYQVFVLTVPVMVALLATLIVIWLRIREPRAGTSALQGWLVALPFSVYLGWITVATIANVTQQLWNLGFRGEAVASSIWAVGILAVGLLITTVMLLRGRDVAYGAVIVWAYAGIAVKQSDVDLVPAFAIAGAVYVLALMALVILRPMLGSRVRTAAGAA